MKKILVIGDLHGRNIWKKFADIDFLLKADKDAAGFGPFIPEYDHYIFIGDYCDSFTITNEDILDNIKDLIKFKKLYPDNVVLLWGNHELHYILDIPWATKFKYVCSGYRAEMHYQLYEIFNKNFDIFQMAFQISNHLFTHAGVHKGWYNFEFLPNFKNDVIEKLEKLEIDYTINNISDKLNLAFIHRLDCLFDVGYRRGGSKRVGGPFWLDKALTNKIIDGYHQYVGHNPVEGIQKYKPYGNDNSTITFLDVLHKRKSFYKLNI